MSAHQWWRHFFAALGGRPIIEDQESAPTPTAPQFEVAVVDPHDDLIWHGPMAVPPAIGDTWEGPWPKEYVVDHRIWDVDRPHDDRHRLIVVLADRAGADGAPS